MRRLLSVCVLATIICVACGPSDEQDKRLNGGLAQRRAEYEETRKVCIDRGGVPIVEHDYYALSEFVKVTHCDFPPTLPSLRVER